MPAPGRSAARSGYAQSVPTPLLVLLPGLDGTGTLFEPLLGWVPAGGALRLPAGGTCGGRTARTVSYPRDIVLTYTQLVDRVADELDHAGPIVLVAESYSGPVALGLAERLGERVVAIVLIASFVENPTWVPRWIAALVPDWLFRVVPPRWVLRTMLLAPDSAEVLVGQLAAAITSVAPRVLAARVREVLTLQAPERLPSVPILYLQAAQDRLVSRRALGRIQALRRVDVATIDGPHLLAQTAPAEVWGAIAAFVGAVQTGR